MMRVDNKPLTEDPALIRDIQAEVTTETRPLLQFIVDNAKYIIALICALLVALAGTGTYQYVQKRQLEKTTEALAKIQQTAPDAAQITALETLAKDSPERLQTAVYMALAQSALAQGNTAKAAEAYSRVARQNADTPVGQMAAVNEAGVQFAAGKFSDGVKILEAIISQLPAGPGGDQIRVMLAEGAARAGNYDLAVKTYQGLAGSAQNMQADYYRARVEAISAEAKTAPEKKSDTAASPAPAAK